jgi:hypothetical protein
MTGRLADLCVGVCGDKLRYGMQIDEWICLVVKTNYERVGACWARLESGSDNQRLLAGSPGAKGWGRQAGRQEAATTDRNGIWE